MPMLDARGVQVSFGQRPVLNGIDFVLKPGELVGLVGPNGSGKTTLLHTLTGYMHASAGNVQLGGHAIESLSRASIARQLAFVPQFTDTVYGFTVDEMVLMGRYPYSGFAMVDSSKHAALTADALAQLGIAHLHGRIFNELSGGERQLVLLARALVQETPILIMDEPLTALDLRHQFEVMQGLHTHAHRPGNAAVATFHDLPAAARWCDRIVLLKAGNVVASGPPREVISPANLEAVYGVQANVEFNNSGDMILTVQSVAGGGRN